MRWITREDIKVDRVACPWLIKRFVDRDAEFLFVPESELLAAATREDATPFDATRFAEVTLNHRGDRCTFEAILEDFHLSDPALQRLGRIVRAADVKGQESAAPEGIGLHCEIGARTRDPQRVSRLATAARKQHVDLDVTNIQIDKSTGGEDHRGKLAAGNASGPVPPFDMLMLSAKGSLYVTRPTLVTYTSTRPALLAMADEMFGLVKAGKIVNEARQTYALKDAAQAHRDLEARNTTGSTLLLP